MEMEIKNEFWYLDCGKDKFLFDNDTEAIDKLKQLAKKNKTKVDDLNLQKMEIKNDKMELKAISWQTIAMELMK